MDQTEKSIFEQFAFWKFAPAPGAIAQPGVDYIVVGCGTSYNLAMSAAVALNEHGLSAIAVPGNEWLRRPRSYKAALQNAHVIVISRSGETTEAVQAASASRSNGLPVTAITCEGASSLVVNADQTFVAKTHPDEGIVMTCSASLMLLLALRFAGVDAGTSAEAAQNLLARLDSYKASYLRGRTHFGFSWRRTALWDRRRRRAETPRDGSHHHRNLSPARIQARTDQRCGSSVSRDHALPSRYARPGGEARSGIVGIRGSRARIRWAGRFES
jgi:D-arabinose 5-phosphate isomerase GutQ